MSFNTFICYLLELLISNDTLLLLSFLLKINYFLKLLAWHCSSLLFKVIQVLLYLLNLLIAGSNFFLHINPPFLSHFLKLLLVLKVVCHFTSDQLRFLFEIQLHLLFYLLARLFSLLQPLVELISLFVIVYLVIEL